MYWWCWSGVGAVNLYFIDPKILFGIFLFVWGNELIKNYKIK